MLNNRLCVAAALGSLLSSSAPFAASPRHGNLIAAHQLMEHAAEKITAAQKANEYDMGGHAQKAKELLEQATVELKQATEAANDHAEHEHVEHAK